jgi:two-component system, cell cycle response regulator CpdR
MSDFDDSNIRERHMGQSKPIRARALVVEDDELQRELIVALLEECDLDVMQCESAEAAELILQKIGGAVAFLFADVQLAGQKSGTELAKMAQKRFPNIRIVVTSGNLSADVPEGVRFMPKPWFALDLLREAERSVAQFH